MKTDLALADFVIATPYSLSTEDIIAIEKTSKGHPSKDDWGVKKLEKFRNNVRTYYKKAQNQKCAYCRMDINVATGYFHIEHIVAKSVHPEWMYEPLNLCLACPICNSSKNNKEVLVDTGCTKLPVESSGYLIIHPHMDNYFDHIEIVDGLIYKGLTPKGIKTIELCNLTRTPLLAERAKMYIKSEQTEGTFARLFITYTLNSRYIENLEELQNEVQQIIKIFCN